MNFSLNKLPKKERIKLIGEFYDIFASLKGREEVRSFLKDLLNPDEIGNLMRRIDVAILLTLGFTYDETSKLLNVSHSKITAVQKVLAHKGEGYKTVIKRVLERRTKRKIKETMKQRKIIRKQEKPDIEALKKKYSLHFLFWNILDEFQDYFFAKDQIKSSPEEAKEFYSETNTKIK